MLEFKHGNLFDTQAPIIAHGCNCQAKMGSGVALQIKQRFPDAYKAYRKACSLGSFQPGNVQVVTMDDGLIIANLATQEGYGRNPNTRYAHPEHVRKCLTKLVDWANEHNYRRIAVPRIGCGLGGLSWERDIAPILDDLTRKYPGFYIEVWTQ